MYDDKPLVLPEEAPAPAKTDADISREQIAKYLLSLGSAHRDLWVRRLKKGMKPPVKARLDSLAAVYHAETTPAEEPVETQE